MSDPVRWTGQMPPAPNQAGGRQPARQGGGGGGGDGTNLADILERVLDKGIVIAGDVQINLLDIELLTIKLRLVVASVDRAKEMGIDWWERDPTLSSGHAELEEENRRLRERLEALEGGDAPALERGRRNGDATEDEPADEAEDDVTDDQAAETAAGDTGDTGDVGEEPEPEPVRPRRKRGTSG